MLAARMVQMFHFSGPSVTQRLRFDDGDWNVRPEPARPSKERVYGGVDIIDLDGKVKTVVHPGNASDCGKILSPFQEDMVSVRGH